MRDGHDTARAVDHLAPGHDSVLIVVLVLGCTHSNLSVAGAILGPLIDICRAKENVLVIHNHQLGMHLRFQGAAFSC